LIVGISIGTATSLYLLRTNKFGDSLWTKKIGQDDEYIWGSSIVQESDTSYLVAGTYIGNISGSNSTNDFILRINLDGDTLMFKRFPKATFDSEMKLVKNENGGYYFNSGSQLVNLDSVLNITWQKDFYYGIGGQLFDIKTTADKGCIMVGARYASYSSYDLDIYMVRINSNGDTLWTRSLSGPMKEVARGVVQTSDGGFAVVGSTDHDNLSLNGDAFFLKLNATGDITTNIGLALSLSQLGIQLYPNPAQDWLTISSTSIEDLPKGKLQLFDSQGKMVKTVAIAPHQQQLKVDVSDLSSGVYLIQIDGKSVSGSSKLIVR
jgi:hypothetical protein